MSFCINKMLKNIQYSDTQIKSFSNEMRVWIQMIIFDKNIIILNIYKQCLFVCG